MSNLRSNQSLIIKISWPILVSLLCIFLYINAGSIQAPGRLPGQIGPAAWPRAILITLIFCSLLKIILDLRRGRHGSMPEEGTGESVGEVEVIETLRSRKILVIAILLVFGFVLAIDVLGFFLGCLLFLWTFTYLGGWMKKIYLSLITTLGSLFITFLFVKWVYIPLPKGRFFFEDITIAIYKALGIF